jgi:hypothetical protein
MLSLFFHHLRVRRIIGGTITDTLAHFQLLSKSRKELAIDHPLGYI